MDNPIIQFKTSKGTMTAELYEDRVPNTVANVISLAQSGFYKGQAFHRIIPGFMAQGGCPNSREDAGGMPGTGGPGYRFADECVPELVHDGTGILSMANAGPDTNGSQFFICFAPAPWLNGKHAVFGKVTDGLDVLEAIQKAGTSSGRPLERISLDIEVVECGDGPYEPDTL